MQDSEPVAKVVHRVVREDDVEGSIGKGQPFVRVRNLEGHPSAPRLFAAAIACRSLSMPTTAAPSSAARNAEMPPDPQATSSINLTPAPSQEANSRASAACNQPAWPRSSS